MSFYHCANSPKAGKGLFPKILVSDVRKIPICKCDDTMITKISTLVKSIINDGVMSSNIDKQIDDIVYDMYNINDEEQLYINNWFA